MALWLKDTFDLKGVGLCRSGGGGAVAAEDPGRPGPPGSRRGGGRTARRRRGEPRPRPPSGASETAPGPLERCTPGGGPRRQREQPLLPCGHTNSTSIAWLFSRLQRPGLGVPRPPGCCIAFKGCVVPFGRLLLVGRTPQRGGKRGGRMQFWPCIAAGSYHSGSALRSAVDGRRTGGACAPSRPPSIRD